jgi:apoptosis-inducing factor 2
MICPSADVAETNCGHHPARTPLTVSTRRITMAEAISARPTVVVVGGGYAGINAAKALDDVAHVVLVEPKDAFQHNVAALRALVDPSWLAQIFLPYAGLLANGRVVRDRAVRVDARTVQLASGEVIAADYIVLATGSSYAFPAKSDMFDTDEARARYRAAHSALAGAQRVMLLGAGPVGIELAGEIAAVWPDKDVVLVDMADDVLEGPFTPELRAELRRQLGEAGVTLMLGSPLRTLPDSVPGQLRTFTVTTEAGDQVTADLWYRCYGVRPVTDYLADDLAAARRQDGFLDVTPFLQVAGHDTVFAVGDIGAADRNMAGIASRQATLVADNIRAAITGEAARTPWEPGPGVIVVPIGPTGGSGQLPGTDGPATAETVSQLKGKDMLIGRYAELMGVVLPERNDSAAAVR